MPRIEVKPGRARVSLKVWTDSISIDSPGTFMAKEAALVMYQIQVASGLPWAEELANVRALVGELGSAETTPERRRLASYELTNAQAALSNKVAACGLLGD